MKVQVVRKFKDKHNDKLYAVGDVLNVTKIRFDELKKARFTYVKEIKVEK